jgi:hypothetical protein
MGGWPGGRQCILVCRTDGVRPGGDGMFEVSGVGRCDVDE